MPPKSERANRTLEMPPKLAALMQSLRNRENADDDAFIFRTELGEPIDPDSVYDVLHGAQDKAGVARFGLHGLRHLYTSLLVANNADVKFAQKKLGHASAMTTLDIYAYAVTDQGREFASKVEAAFPSVSNLLAERQSGELSEEIVN